MSPTIQPNPPKMGIYLIRCNFDGRVYVGQSRRIKGRWYDHLNSLSGGKGSPKLQKAWDLYGGCHFSFEVLEEVTDPSDLESREQHYLDTFQAATRGMNTLPTAGSFHGYTPDEEARRKIGEASRNRSPETLSKLRVAHLGKKKGPHSSDTRAKISAAQKGIPRGPMPPEKREAISKALKGKPQSPARIASAEARRGVPRTDDVRLKVSDAKKGKPFPEEQRLKMLGRTLSDDHKSAMSCARKGVPWTQARREAQARKVQESGRVA